MRQEHDNEITRFNHAVSCRNFQTLNFISISSADFYQQTHYYKCPMFSYAYTNVLDMLYI